MQVNRIEKLTQKKSRIYLDNGRAYPLYNTELARYGITEEGELSEADAEELETLLYKRARLRCMKLLQTTDYTEYQLGVRLQRSGYDQEMTDRTIAYLKSFRYVDDRRYARTFLETQSSRKSKMQLKQDLQRRGVPREVIDEELAEAETVPEEELIRSWIEKKHVDLSERADRKEIQKFCQFLYRKGFSAEKIRRVIGSYGD